MKILVIFTGGTIGSEVKDGYISPTDKNGYRLIKEYKKVSSYPILISGKESNTQSLPQDNVLVLDTVAPFQILSENLNGDYINSLTNCVRSSLTAQNASDPSKYYDGIIVTHGTDTLQYTAASLGYSFADSDIPIILVSSNYILDDERANGLDNFFYAVEFIKQHSGKGVFVSYRNGTDTQLMHRASRLLPHTPHDDLIYSVGNQFYGSFLNGTFVYNPEYVAAPDDTYISQSNPATHSADYSGAVAYFKGVKLTKYSPVLYVKPIPGQAYPSVIDKSIRAILLDSYHSGTICTSDNGIYDFVKLARAMEVPVFLTGVENRIGYESTKAYFDLGVLVLPKSSPIAMYMKLWSLCCINLSEYYLCDIMCSSIGEDIL